MTGRWPGDRSQTVMVTRLRHPLEGQSLRVLGWMRRHGQMELLLELSDGSKRLIPAEWTDQCADGAASVIGTEAGVVSVAGTLGSIAALLAASGLVSALSAREAGERGQAARQSPSKEDSRAACAAQSAAGPGSGATPHPAGPVPRTADRRSGHAAGPPDRQGLPSGRSRGEGAGERW